VAVVGPPFWASGFWDDDFWASGFWNTADEGGGPIPERARIQVVGTYKANNRTYVIGVWEARDGN
jgi:hypothetical protein